MNSRSRKWVSCLAVVLFVLLLMISLGWLLIRIPLTAKDTFGPSSASLNPLRKIEYSTKLLIGQRDLLVPADKTDNSESHIEIAHGQSIVSIASELNRAGLVSDPEIFRTYLIYSGIDTKIQAGSYVFRRSQSPYEIANKLVDATPDSVTFSILPGWRAEEIAATLTNSGLSISQEVFLGEVRSPSYKYLLNGQIHNASLEGYLLPGQYEVPRNADVRALISIILEKFNAAADQNLLQGFQEQGLSLEDAVILASIVQRETIQPEEAPLIASVFLNRLNSGMKLDSDPTVQYALGFDPTKNTWWKNPLSLADLKVISSYNTYQQPGLPPAAICNPGLSALNAVAHPESSNYFYFRAKCDNSGYHSFSVTFDEHMQNACP